MSDKTDTFLFDGKNPIDEIAKDDIINTYRTHCSVCKIGGAFMAGIRKKSPERKTAIREFAERFYFDNQRSPSMTEIAAELKISRSTAYEYLVEMDHPIRRKADRNGKYAQSKIFSAICPDCTERLGNMTERVWSGH